MSSFSIHQFSSGIRNPDQNREGKWVSGGYDKEIAKESYNVPPEIKKAVNTSSKGGWRGFGIPDAFPPKTGYYALIARELENYCVLAVANQQQDDHNRPFIAYRYFWLDKQEFQNERDFSDFDGIATLLYHWRQKGNPQYDIGEWTNSPELYTNSWDKLKKYDIKTRFFQLNLTRIGELISSINSSNESLNYNKPLIYEANQIGGSLEPEEVHCLAIQYSHIKKCSINWVWNVRRLENMQDLRVIYCADTNSFKWFNKQLSIPIPNPSEKKSQTSSSNPTDQDPETKNIQTLFGKLSGDLTKEDVLQLMDYYQEHKHNIVIFKSQNAIDYFVRQMPKSDDKKIKYATLLTTLAPKEKKDIKDILGELMKLNSKLKNGVAIKFLDDLLRIATQDSDCFDHQSCGLLCKNFTYTRSKIRNLGKIYLPKTNILNLFDHNLIKNISILNLFGRNLDREHSDQDSEKIEYLLRKLCGNFTKEDVFQLMNFYQENQQYIVEFKDEKVINNLMDETSKNKVENIKYVTLLTALAPKEKEDILGELMKLDDNLKHKAIIFLDKLLRTAALSPNCFNHPIYELFCKNFTYTKFKLVGTLNNNSFWSVRNVIFAFALFIPFSLSAVAAGMYWRPNISITISTRRNGYKNLVSFEIPPTSTPITSVGKEGSLAELLNEYNSKYKAIKILEPNKKNNTNIEKISNTLYEELNRDKQKIVNLLTEMEAEQYIQQLQDSDPNQVIDARQKEIYTNLEQFTPKIITEKLPVLKSGVKDKVNVTILQNALKRNRNYNSGQGNYNPGEFGEFDNSTQKAVENLQETYIQKSTTTMKKDGKVGASTWNLLIGRLKDLQVEKVYEILNKHLELDNQTDYNIVTEIKKCRDNNQNEKALEFVNCLEKLND